MKKWKLVPVFFFFPTKFHFFSLLSFFLAAIEEWEGLYSSPQKSV